MHAFAKILLDLGSSLGLVFYFIPLIVLIATIFGAYLIGGKLGLIGIGAAFLGGLSLLNIPLLGIILVLIGIAIGNLSVKQLKE